MSIVLALELLLLDIRPGRLVKALCALSDPALGLGQEPGDLNVCVCVGGIAGDYEEGISIAVIRTLDTYYN